MAWTDERIDTLKKMWEDGQTASQIAEALGQVSRNAVIGKAHRLGLQSRPSPVKPNEVTAEVVAKPVVEPAAPKPVVAAAPEVFKPVEVVAAAPAAPAFEADEDEDAEISDAPAAAPAPVAPPQPILRSVGPGGFLRQSPGEQQAPITPAPPRRLVPAKPSADMAGKTTLLDLSDRICKWPLGHPGEPDFHFCGEKVNPGFPYCVAHCGHAYQAQLPRRDRRPPPPLPFGGPRVR
ncbi:GcrA cell cycle regulator [Sphingomonas panacis]|uniref:GcrA cell cycle regulator n=1 Tax=Sphingomonas panacis TaxID=1560345 RepID=A0A1B3Z9C4_9SPHN|nr:GcrA family cell cycle regulator [Sphingomonas panacis]AOH84006.1 GcrA cell cycle regulator [Sphingomonas panacis]